MDERFADDDGERRPPATVPRGSSATKRANSIGCKPILAQNLAQRCNRTDFAGGLRPTPSGQLSKWTSSGWQDVLVSALKPNSQSGNQSAACLHCARW